MPRPARPRPLGEHVSVLLRVMRQVDADRSIRPARARKIKQALSVALGALQQELAAK